MVVWWWSTTLLLKFQHLLDELTWNLVKTLMVTRRRILLTFTMASPFVVWQFLICAKYLENNWMDSHDIYSNIFTCSRGYIFYVFPFHLAPPAGQNSYWTNTFICDKILGKQMRSHQPLLYKHQYVCIVGNSMLMLALSSILCLSTASQSH